MNNNRYFYVKDMKNGKLYLVKPFLLTSVIKSNDNLHLTLFHKGDVYLDGAFTVKLEGKSNITLIDVDNIEYNFMFYTFP